mmetsp:Transcript_71171/g.112496  ORF Transcript_71171/g.112496 Transcript_71171/m.112496 type:complete len:437 (+) Transcript_71171:42-1352(+)
MANYFLDLTAQDAPTLFESFPVVAVPALFMMIGSVVAFFIDAPKSIVSATQNFSGGLLISAVAGELYPLMNGKEQPLGLQVSAVPKPSDLASTLAIGAGFAIGLLFMFGVEYLADEDEEQEEETSKQTGNDTKDGVSARRRSLLKDDLSEPMLDDVAMTDIKDIGRKLKLKVMELGQNVRDGRIGTRDELDDAVHGLRLDIHAARRRLKKLPALLAEAAKKQVASLTEQLLAKVEAVEAATSSDEIVEALQSVKDLTKEIHEAAEKSEKKKIGRRFSVNEKLTEVVDDCVDWSQVFAVCVDSAVDGLLIGLAFAAAEGAGWAMSIATTLEMGFLGLSFSLDIHNQTPSKVKHFAIVVVPPLVLLSVGMLGHFVGGILQESPLSFIGFISFAVVALLFLTTQELLIKAHEVSGDSKIINSLFFVGLYCGILLAKYVG